MQNTFPFWQSGMFFINRQDWSLWNTFIFLYSTPQLKVVSQGQNECKTHLYSKYINKDCRNILCIAQQWNTPKCQHCFNYVRVPIVLSTNQTRNKRNKITFSFFTHLLISQNLYLQRPWTLESFIFFWTLEFRVCIFSCLFLLIVPSFGHIHRVTPFPCKWVK